MLCSELMHPDPAYLYEDDVVQTAAKRMRDEDIRFVSVCDFSKRLSGTVTAFDLVVRVVADDLRSSTRRVVEVMNTHLVACRPDDDITRARELMDQHHLDAMPITDADGILKGVIDRDAVMDPERAHPPVGRMRESVARSLRSAGA